MSMTIQCVNIHKNYMGKTALKNINLKFETGRIYGLLGPNGSGKTTLMKIVADLHKQSSGEITIDGQAPSHKTKSQVAFMPTENFLYGWMRVKDALAFYKDMYVDFSIERANVLLEFMELDLKQKTSSLSTGQRSRLKIALTLSRNAKVYMLDEPLNGLDPISREKIKETIIERFDSESIMIIATHLVTEIEQILDEVVFISNGEVVLKGEIEAIRQDYNLSLEGVYKEVFKHDSIA